jgi:TetR/AcrR family transcriptional regulator, acrAB operon repressor
VVRRTKDEAAETRSRIIDAAERVFGRRGVTRTSLDDIARAAGVTRGAIYWHFKGKGDIFQAMVKRVMLPMEAMVGKSSEAAVADPLRSLRAAAVYALKRTATDRQCQRVFDVVTHKCEYLDEMAEVKRRIITADKGCVQQAMQAIGHAVRRGLLPRGVDPRLAAIGLDAMLYGLIAKWLMNPGYLRLEREAPKLVDLYLAGLRMQAPVRRRARKRARPNPRSGRRAA